MHIRPADVMDADSVFDLLREFATSYPARRPEFDRNYERLLAAMTYDTTDFLVAEDGGQVIGYALAARFLVLYANGWVSELQELVVTPCRRGQGVGRKLVEAVVARARATGAVEVTVPTRRARDYYRRLGFVETASFLKLELS
ncbi:GNAT family N-acetyltransferase [Amycolatopsis cynarae]|uniref:GNAT family N-acetyltransferase n=1 Tax=Amycolatopsis cynarae TaxID=2995223 RepID=A0ABY7B4R0_9PSEU|nr:GNAT family N-acetyltransferase [Amycolatopsis sp. HUAS 11-8]WAL67307.1 GNAT family N-acetyltransferase [Amycolatopsis sp. HUAS 11-8]